MSFDNLRLAEQTLICNPDFYLSIFSFKSKSGRSIHKVDPELVAYEVCSQMSLSIIICLCPSPPIYLVYLLT